MGGAAGKQKNQIKKIYVKSKEETGDGEDEVLDSFADQKHVNPIPVAELGYELDVDGPAPSKSQLGAKHSQGAVPDSTALSSGLATGSAASLTTVEVGSFAASMAKIREDNERQAQDNAWADAQEAQTAPDPRVPKDVARINALADALVGAKPLLAQVAAQSAVKPNRSKLGKIKSLVEDVNDVVEMNSASKPDHNFNLSPRSISSDEGSVADAPKQSPLPAIPKAKFSDDLQCNYAIRAQERSAWLKSLGDADADPVFVKAGTRANGGVGRLIVGSGFDSTQRQSPSLREPDIMQQVRKWNVLMNRDEVPKGRPLRA